MRGAKCLSLILAIDVDVYPLGEFDQIMTSLIYAAIKKGTCFNILQRSWHRRG